MSGFRVESAMRMEFRRKFECVEVYNDDRKVAVIEGEFIAFVNDAAMSLDETACVVAYARDAAERDRAQRHREHLAAYDGMRLAARVLCAYERVPVPPTITVVIDGMHCNVPMTERDA